MAKLESQLDKTKETAILDRQAAQAARTDLWRKEKELADAKLDLRISEREVKSLKEDLAKLKVNFCFDLMLFPLPYSLCELKKQVLHCLSLVLFQG